MRKRITVKATGAQGVGKSIVLRKLAELLENRGCTTVKFDSEKHTVSLDALTEQQICYLLLK